MSGFVGGVVGVVICRILGLIPLMGVLISVVLIGVIVGHLGHDLGGRGGVLGSVDLGGLRISWTLVGTSVGTEPVGEPR